MSRGYVYILLCFVFLGIGTPVSRDAVAVVPPWLFMIMTLVVGCVAMLPFFLREKPRAADFTTGVILSVGAQALLGAVLFTIFLLYGLTHSSTVVAGVVNSTTPAVTLILAILFLKEKSSPRKLLSIGCAVAGLLIVSVVGAGPVGGSSMTGIVFMLLSVLSVSTFFVVAKYLAVLLEPAKTTMLLLVWALVLSLPLGLREAVAFDWSLMTPLLWTETAFYGIFVWMLPFYFTYLGIRTVPASAVGMATAITPVSAITTAVILYGETLTPQAVVALVLVIVSIIIAESGPRDTVAAPAI